MQDQVLARLGVDANALAMLSAWVSTERFITTKESVHLEAVRETLRGSDNGGAPIDDNSLSLADQAHTCRIGRQRTTRAAICKRLQALSTDAFKQLSPAQLATVLEVVAMTHHERPTDQKLLEEALRASADSELECIWGRLSEPGDAQHIVAADMEMCMTKTKVCMKGTQRMPHAAAALPAIACRSLLRPGAACCGCVHCVPSDLPFRRIPS
jgi:hypothetical protein